MSQLTTEHSVVKPKVRGFLCTTAHPLGCHAHIQAQIEQVQSQLKAHDLPETPKRVLIIGGSAGYGLSSRILCAVGYGARTVSVSMEKAPTERKTATAGWYNNYYLDHWLTQQGQEAYSISGDAFSQEIKQQTLSTIKETLGQVDLVVYSLAAPRRVKMVDGGETARTYQSVIKPIDQTFEGRTIDTATGQLKAFSLDPASQDEIEHTVTVMGGEDWYDWMVALKEADLLSNQIQTVAFSYLGGELTKAIYGAATLGRAKEDVEFYCEKINAMHTQKSHSVAKVAVLKAIVTQSSAAIPSLPLYISVLYRVMKEQGSHEGCMDQIIRLFGEALYPSRSVDERPKQDKPYRYRLDDRELTVEVQQAVTELWQQVSQENLTELTDFSGYQSDFLKLFGFDWPGIDYNKAVSFVP